MLRGGGGSVASYSTAVPRWTLTQIWFGIAVPRFVVATRAWFDPVAGPVLAWLLQGDGVGG